jgi:ribonuclease R
VSRNRPRKNRPGRRQKLPTDRARFASDRGRGGKPGPRPGDLPEIGIVEITGIDLDGEMQARLVGFEGKPPAIAVVAERSAPALGVGERAVVRFSHISPGSYEARIIRALGGAPDRILGVYRLTKDGGRILPTERKMRTEFRVAQGDAKDAADGEIVLAEVLPHGKLGLPEARILERIGDSADPRAFSLIAIHSHGIPTVFAKAAVDLAEAAKPVDLGTRTDLRKVPLVTIDGADARDFDDAVWAEADPSHQGGWHALVAIADVAWYVRPFDALDETARERGNSVYFPDRVVPMLPEALSNELCSLKPAVERACMVCEMWIDAQGNVTRHRFQRGLMRSAARLTYEEVQAAVDGRPSDKTAALVEPLFRPLYGAYAALDRARQRRGTLDLDIPERKIVLDPSGRIARIEPRARLDSHKLIEEMMIAANVAAAETLERLKQPCMYRIHDSPDPEKLAALTKFLEGIGIPGLALSKGQVVRPQQFNTILKRAKGTPYEALVNQLVLRTQAQAAYSPDNIGHFGLSLRRYAHFTSPIRRYADLLVHRALIAGHHWGSDGLPQPPENFTELGEHISTTERRAAAAERSAADRYTAAFLAERIGAQFTARIGGVTRAGLFVTLDETGADGFVPMRSLGDDYYIHDEARHCLRGRRSGRVYTMGDAVTVRLGEADTVTGSLLFALVDEARPHHPQPQTRRKHRR